MDIDQIKQQFRGRKFGELILHHRKVTDMQTTVKSLQGTIQELPNSVQPLMESWFDEMNLNVRSEQFWQQDCGDAFVMITNTAEAKLRAVGVQPTNDDLFNMFQIIVLNFAYSTHRYPKSKAFIQKAIWGWHPRQVLSIAIQPTSALIITTLCAVWGTITDQPYLWIPYTGIAASIVDFFTRSWVTSEKTGEWVVLSVLLKFALSLVGFYAMLIQFTCFALGIYWIIIK
ncbi:MAG: hypothetical protein NTV01_07160 [Bacteroidia bacterium]|nr:hypothetical protein [Bacteroidia bacterium]